MLGMRYVVIVALASQQYIAIALIYAAIPAILRRNGAPLELIGFFGTVFFAFTINFLWAPIVDRYSLTRLGRRRSWIIAMQIAGAAAVAFMAALDPATAFVPIFITSIVLATFSATQRVATLGYVAEALGEDERAIGAAAFGWGGALGNIIGGAVGLYLIETTGWPAALSVMALLMLCFAGLILAVREPMPAGAESGSVRASIVGVIKRADVRLTVLLIAPATFGVAVAFAMVQPRIVDLGIGLTNIGTIVACAHLAAFTIIGPVFGLAASRVRPLRSIAVGGFILAFGFATIAVLDAYMEARWSAFTNLAFVFAALAVQNVAFSTLFLSLARPGEAATDVTILMAAMSALALLGFSASGFIAARLGFGATLVIAGIGYAITAIVAWRLSTSQKLLAAAVTR